MSTIVYVLSQSFPYEKTICDDAGPRYARRHKWTTALLDELRGASKDAPLIIDHRLTETETAHLMRLAAELRGQPFYVKVVDPHWDCIRQPYYQWLLGLTRFPNICFIGPYQPMAMTALLVELSERADAYFHLPYAYEGERELPLDHGRRSKFLAFSGATNSTFYPERAAMLRAIRRHWWRAQKVNVLPHPGYPDVGQTARHAVTGDAYIRFLAGHRFMYLEPSRDGLEFLKYSECAYAGCVPAGRAPATFEPELRDMILPLESARLPRDLRRLAAAPSATCGENARRYRERLRRWRDPAALNAQLLAHWRTQRDRLSVHA